MTSARFRNGRRWKACRNVWNKKHFARFAFPETDERRFLQITVLHCHGRRRSTVAGAAVDPRADTPWYLDLETTKMCHFFTSIDEGQNEVSDRITSRMRVVEEVGRREVREIDHHHHEPVASNNKSIVAVERKTKTVFHSNDKRSTPTERKPSLISISLIRSELMKIVFSRPIT